MPGWLYQRRLTLEPLAQPTGHSSYTPIQPTTSTDSDSGSDRDSDSICISAYVLYVRSECRGVSRRIILTANIIYCLSESYLWEGERGSQRSRIEKTKNRVKNKQIKLEVEKNTKLRKHPFFPSLPPSPPLSSSLLSSPLPLSYLYPIAFATTESAGKCPFTIKSLTSSNNPNHNE